MKTRNWSIRSKIIALVTVPLAALVALWIFATTLTVGPAAQLLATQTMLKQFGEPGQTVVKELQTERLLSVVYLASKGQVPGLAEQRAKTDESVADLRRRIMGGDLRNAASGPLNARLDEV